VVRRAFLAGLVLLLGAAGLTAAPAPTATSRARWLTPREMAGEWWMQWGGSLAHLTLSGDGRYLCNLGGARYAGTWSWTAGGDLVVTEGRERDAADGSTTWTVTFRRDGHGRLDRADLRGTSSFGGGLPVRLVRKR
jgi:hypothetical protein